MSEHLDRMVEESMHFFANIEQVEAAKLHAMRTTAEKKIRTLLCETYGIEETEITIEWKD